MECPRCQGFCYEEPLTIRSAFEVRFDRQWVCLNCGFRTDTEMGKHQDVVRRSSPA